MAEVSDRLKDKLGAPPQSTQPPPPAPSEAQQRVVAAESGAPFGMEIGPFIGGDEVAPSRPVASNISPALAQKFGVSQEEKAARAERGRGITYVTTPPIDERRVAQATFNALVAGADRNPYATSALLSDLDLIAGASEMAFVMNGTPDLWRYNDPENNPLAVPADIFQSGVKMLQDNPELMEEFADYYWTDMLAALTSTYGMRSSTDNSLENRSSSETLMRFHNVFRNEFSPEEWDLIFNITAAVPTSEELLLAKDIDPNPSNPWGTIVRNVKMAVQAPEAIRPFVNEPVDQLLNLAEDYWRNVDNPEDPATKYEFFNFMMSQANGSIADIERIQTSGFAALAAGTVDIIPTVALDAANDAALGIRSVMPWSVGPNEYGARQGMSLGQNSAIGSGFHANDPNFRDVSGTFDAAAQIFGDPQNLIFGAASAKKAANTFPRIASRSETFKAALNPFSKANAGKLPLHAMDTSNSARLFYAAFSKTADELLLAPKATKQLEWIGRTASAASISRRFPDLSQNVVQFLAETQNVDEARQVWRYFMHGDEVVMDAPQQIVARLRANSIQTEREYVTAVRKIVEAEGDEFNLARFGFDDGIDPSDIYIEVKPSRATPLTPDDFDEGVTDSVLRSERSFANGEEVDVFDFNGSPARIVKSGSNLGVYVDDQFIGAARNLDGKAPDVAIAKEFREQGLGRRLTQNMTPQQVENLRNAAIKSGSAEALVPTRILRRSKLSQDGSKKVVVSTLGNRGRKLTLKDDRDFYRMTQWLDNNGHEELSTVIASGGRLDQLTPDEFRALDKYMEARGVDMLSWGDEAYLRPGASLDIVSGVDGEIDRAASLSRTLPDEYYNWRSSRLTEDFSKKDINGEKWVIHDLPSRKFSANLYDFGRFSNRALPKRWQQKMRSTGFVMKHKYPENIDMSNAVHGRNEVRDWSKALGMSDEWADKWVARFDKANPITRKEVLDEWLVALGNERNLPWLKYNLVSRVRKGGVSTFESGVDGREIGLAADGSVTPMTLSHSASFYMMPDAHELMKSVKRWEQRSPIRMHRGITKGTQSRRAKIVDDLKKRMQRQGFDTRNLSREDFARLAYSDSFRSEVADYRGYGAGKINKVATAPVKIAKGFGSFFSIAQLAGRPIAWNSRVLIEESVRDLLMGSTAMLRNPVAYFNNVWDSASIARMRFLEATSVEETARWVNKLWDAGSGTADLATLRKMFPEIDFSADIWTRGDILSLVSREFKGGRNFTPSTFYPSRLSPYRKAYKNNRRILAAKRRIAEYNSIDETFRWNIDGKDIANRSYTTNFVEEVGASSLPLEWKPAQMTPHQIDAAGHGYGRQAKQMLEDPIVGSYGVSRMRARLLGQNPDAKYSADKLVGSGHWDSVEYLVDKRLAGDGISPNANTRVEKAQWYLDNVVDNISETLFRPLIDEMDEVAGAEALKGLRNQRTAVVVVNGEELVLDVDEYGAAKTSFVDFANAAAANPDRMFPPTISAYFEPRFGELKSDGALKWARKFLDREMMFFGETTTQALHRRPAFLASKESFYNRYKAFGWSDEVADAASTNRAAVVTNYVFFDNSAIPQVLHEMNKIFPFFSAMFEVGQTWAYKIPMMSYYGFGLGHMVRRIDRTLSGMHRSGMLQYDEESGAMTFTATNDLDNDSKIVSALSAGAFGIMRQPINFMETMSNLADLVNGGGYESADFSSWYKDGFKFSVGNPVDPTSYGVMAVNQFSVGLTPMWQGAASVLARSAYAWDDEIVQIQPQSAADYIEAHPDADIGLLMSYNRAGFEEANGKETFDRAKLRQIDLTELKMPEELRLPKSSWWETMLDNTVFPFGKYRGGWNVLGDVIAAPLPSALSYVARGWGMTGQGETNDWLGLFLGNLSSYQAHAELATQIQMLEASEGYLTRARNLSADIEAFKTSKKLEINGSGDAQVASGGSDADRAELQTMLDDLEELNTDLVRRATGNTAGALQTRGILGMLGPVSPSSYVKEQEVIAQYWAGKDLAEEFRAGRGAVRKSVAATNINGIEDMARLARFTQEWLNDDTGDSAKVWLRENMPGLEGFLQGRSYYGTVGLSPITDTFDKWNDGIENGTITGVPPEVYMARHQYAAVSTDKQTAIVMRYGNDVDVATQRILSDGASYYDLVDEYNIKYDVIEWMDEFMYGGAYKDYRNRAELDEFSEITIVDAEIRELGDAISALEDYLQYGNLGDREQSKVLADLRSTRARWRDAREEMAAYSTDYLNPLESNLAAYRDQVREPYADRLDEVWRQVEVAESDKEKSDLYRELRMIQDEAFRTPYEMESVSGQMVPVPPPMVVSWNSKPEEEKALDMYVWLGQPGSWRNQFEVGVLKQQFPLAEEFMPSAESMEHHDWLAQEKAEIRKFARENPDKMTINERDKAIDVIEEQFNLRMAKAGRQSELDFDEATPFQRLDLLGALPESLQPMADRYNLIMADLKVRDKGPQTQSGRTEIIKFVDQWLKPTFFANNPQAASDFLHLGSLMYDEDSEETLYGIFLQDRVPLSRKLQ